MRPRSRPLYFLAGCTIVALGLASRRFTDAFPAFFVEYAGDTLWAMMAFVGIAWLMPTWTTLRVAVVALTISCLVEISQLYHAPWVDAIRHTRLGALALGEGFLWSDIVCYAAGVTLAVGADRLRAL